MADTHPEPENTAAPPPLEGRRRKALTPEQRRLLGTPRALHLNREGAADVESSQSPAAPPRENRAVAASDLVPPESASLSTAPSGETRGHAAGVRGQTKASRGIEMQHALIIIGVLVFIIMIFWAGRKFDRVKYLIMSRMNEDELGAGPEKFPGLTSEELVESALAAEKRGDRKDAVYRLMEAKRKNLQYQGIFFRLGKTSFERVDWNGADQALAQALKFGENIAVANHLRGLIAVHRHDLAAAERFFEAAATAEPFVSDYYYFWGETLRLNQRPRDAIRRYQQAGQRTPSAETETLCQFKIRLARIEAAEAAAVSANVEEARKAGPLSLSWLMTDAALQLHAGKLPEAVQLISEARGKSTAGLFQTYASDHVFRKASESHPEIAAMVALPAPVSR